MDQIDNDTDGDSPIDPDRSSHLCGAYISHFGPIRDQYLDLSSGLNCLYGVNGAGKSQILTCIAKSLENSSDLIIKGFNENGEGGWVSGAAFVYTLSGFGAYENLISRMWSHDSMGNGYGLPNADDVLQAHNFDGMARTSELEQTRIPNEIDNYHEHLEFIKRTIDYGRLILVPRPDKQCYQIIYAISADCEDYEFKKFTSEFIAKMKEAENGTDNDQYHDQENHFPDRIAELKGNPVVNVFNVQGHMRDRFLTYYAERWNEENFNYPIQNFPFIPISSLGFVGKAPTVLITEDSIEDIERVNEITRWRLFHYAEQKQPEDELTDDEDEYQWPDDNEVTDNEDSAFMVQANSLAIELRSKIQKLWTSFLPVSPELYLDIGTIREWFEHEKPRWRIGEGYGQNFENLSYAQKRWVRLALALGLRGHRFSGRPNYYQDHQLLIIDEPERGLHRVGESHLANGLLRYAEDNGIALVATHSPAFLNLPTANVSLVSDFRISHLAPLEIEALEQLGLHPSDLLMSYKVFWLVEGQHEIAIFEKLFGDRLKNERIKLIPLRGAKSLSSVVDSTLLFEYTNAKVVLTLDNLNGPVINDAWSKAIAEFKKGRSINKVRDDLSQAVTSRSGEGRQLLEFMSSCLINQVQDRVTLTALSKNDIIEYFEPKEFGLTSSWRELHDNFAKSRDFKNFKDFVIGTYGARVSSGVLSELAEGLEEIPNDFQNCFEAAMITALTAHTT